MTDKTDTPTCWLCKTRPAESKAGTRGYSTSLCDECHAKLNGQVGVDPFETSRPLSAIEYEQRGRIAELSRELSDVKAELRALKIKYANASEYIRELETSNRTGGEG